MLVNANLQLVKSWPTANGVVELMYHKVQNNLHCFHRSDEKIYEFGTNQIKNFPNECKKNPAILATCLKETSIIVNLPGNGQPFEIHYRRKEEGYNDTNNPGLVQKGIEEIQPKHSGKEISIKVKERNVKCTIPDFGSELVSERRELPSIKKENISSKLEQVTHFFGSLTSRIFHATCESYGHLIRSIFHKESMQEYVAYQLRKITNDMLWLQEDFKQQIISQEEYGDAHLWLSEQKASLQTLETIIDEIGQLKEKRDNNKISRSVYLDRLEALLTLKPSIWSFDEFINKAYRQLIKKHETELKEQLERRTEVEKGERLLKRQKRLEQYQKEYQQILNVPCQSNQNRHDEANSEHNETNQEIVPHGQCESILKEKNVIETLTTSSSWLQRTVSITKSLTALLLLSSFSFVRSAHSRSNSPWSNSSAADKALSQGNYVTPPCPQSLYLDNPHFLDGFKITGLQQFESLGQVELIDDVNGDGRADLLVTGEYYPVPNGERPSWARVASTYIIFSRKKMASPFDLSTLNGRNGVRIRPIGGGLSYSNWPATAIGDVNDDGYNDLGTTTVDNNGYVMYGSDSFPPVADWVQSANGRQGFRITTSSSAVMRPLGDVNGDKIADFSVSMPYSNDRGEVSVVLGLPKGQFFPANFPLASLNGTNGCRIIGSLGYRYLGWSVAAGDFDGDGMRDIVIGAYPAHIGGDPILGTTYLVRGNKTYPAAIFVQNLNGQDGFQLSDYDRTQEQGRVGSVVSFAGDINADGRDDLIIGAEGSAPRWGYAFFVLGQPGPFNKSTNIQDFMNGRQGFQFIRGAANSYAGKSGTTISSAGDYNGDNITDVIIYAHPYSNTPPTLPIANVVWGRKNGFPATMRMDSITQQEGMQVFGIPPVTYTFAVEALASVSGGKDFNGDGKPDLAMGIMSANNLGVERTGAVFITFDCRPYNNFITAVEMIGLNRNRAVMIVAYKENQSYYVNGELLNVVDNQTIQSKQLFNFSTSFNKRAYEFHPKILSQNATHFIVRIDGIIGNSTKFQTLTFNQQGEFNTFEESFSIQDKYYMQDVWQTDDKRIMRAQVTTQPSLLWLTLDEKTTEHRLLRSVSEPYMQFIELTKDWYMFFFYEVSTASVWSRIVKLDGQIPRATEFQISNPNTKAVSSDFFVIPLANKGDFAYLGYRNDTHGPFEYQKFTYNRAGYLTFDLAKPLIEISNTEQPISVLSFPDKSFLVFHLNDKNQVMAQLFSYAGEPLGDKQFISGINDKTEVRELVSTSLDHRHYLLAIHKIVNKTHEIEKKINIRNTLWLINNIWQNHTGLIKTWVNASLSQRFITTLATLGTRVSCRFKLVDNNQVIELKPDELNCVLQVYANEPGLFQFHTTANDGEMNMTDVFSLNITRNANQDMQENWARWIALGVSAATGAALLSAGLLSALMWRRYVRQEEQWGKPLGTLYRSFWEKEILKNFVSFIDNETMVSRQHPVVSLVGNIKSSVPNHVYIILESIDDLGQMMIERFELVTPIQAVKSKKSKDEIRVETIQEKVDESSMESSSVMLIDVNQDKPDEKTSLLQNISDHSQPLSGSSQSDRSSISIKNYSTQLSAAKNDEKQMEEIFFRLIAQAKRTNCYYQSWQITDKDAKKLRENILKDEKLYRVEEQPYSIYGQRSYLTLFMSCFFGQPGENCFDWTRKHINQLSIHKKIDEKWTDIIASRSVDYFDQTRKMKYCFTF